MSEDVTPIRRQYLRVKHAYPQALVLFRLGDFYETFDEDARILARDLEIVLTSREMGKGQRVPMAGIPARALDGYLARLVNLGHKVAICEQMTAPGATRGIVDREVTRVVTPGTVVEPALLDSRQNNYLVSLVLGDGEAGIAHVDITTGEFATTQLPLDRAQLETNRLRPSEIICPEGMDLAGWSPTAPAGITSFDAFAFDIETASKSLLDHFKAASLEGFGCASRPLAARAAGAIVQYVGRTQKAALGQMATLSTYSTESFMVLDEQTLNNLEILRNGRTGATEGSLLAAIDLTRTPMGSRLLRRWLSQPLLALHDLTARQEAVGWCHRETMLRAEIVSLLNKLGDLERMTNRVAGGVALPREVVALRRSLEVMPARTTVLGVEGVPPWLGEGIGAFPEVVALIGHAIVDEPSASPGDGNVIREGHSEELDGLRRATRDATQFLADLERKEQDRTGIKSLKVGYNRVFGYYIEISNANLAQAPSDYIRKQTLVGGERYITPELKDYESLILNARERIEDLEISLYKQVCRQIANDNGRILSLAGALARLDVIAGLAEVATRRSYVRPELSNGDQIDIRDGRHPVVEQVLASGAFVPNDAQLDNRGAQIVILTGPNMAGKSTYLKQVALIVLLAQIGSFVPAASASIGLVDRIFTRIGAREDLAAGQSTFMAEMIETANILNNATPRSLLVLDEIGRGTSTYDGLSIARAVAEYIHNSTRLGAKTLFATHYHEMIELAAYLPRVRNYNVAVAENKGDVVFLRKIVPGGADRSYGIHVAQLAGLPGAVVHRAHEVLQELEGGAGTPRGSGGKRGHIGAPALQISLFGQKSPVVEDLLGLDVDSLTPLEALTRLYQLKQMAKGE
jgi:DNA mismatch repair protein MutS